MNTLPFGLIDAADVAVRLLDFAALVYTRCHCVRGLECAGGECCDGEAYRASRRAAAILRVVRGEPVSLIAREYGLDRSWLGRDVRRFRVLVRMAVGSMEGVSE